MQTHADAFRSILGDLGVVETFSELRAAETATYATTSRIPLILKPTTREEVQACVLLANRLKVCLYPISGGKNWGYGSRAPTADACLLDLGGMRRILDYHPKLGYVTIEPGVTQRQLHEFLLAEKAPFWMDSTGASPEASIVGNTMERGFGHTPYADHFVNSCAMEVVLPTGACIQTGFARFEGAHAAPIAKWGTGPILDGLFSQSNFGIVTRMTVWLMPRPDCFQAFFFRCDSDDALSPMMDALQPLRLKGILPSAAHIVNDYKVISGLQQYPWDRMGGAMPLSPEVMRELRRELKFGAWNGSGALYGTKGQIRDARSQLRKALKGIAQQVTLLDDTLLSLVDRFAGPASLAPWLDLRRVLELVKPVYNLMKGIPTEQPLRSAYWRKRFPPPERMDPDRDGCGLFWCAPIAPLTGAHARVVADVAAEALLSHRFEPALSFTLTSGRALTAVISIGYDRDLPGEDALAEACYRELEERLIHSGYRFYRLGLHSMEASASGEEYDALLERIKSTVDPERILSPGRYSGKKFI